jgi:hypothetical protein
MRTKTSASLVASLLALLTWSGCSSTSFEITGTKGAGFHGEYLDADGKHPIPIASDPPIKIPTWWSETEFRIIGPNGLQRCEIRKDDTNALLVLTLKTHGFKGSVASPPGTTGVKVVRDGKRLTAETLWSPKPTN